jgi:hypothetical protein
MKLNIFLNDLKRYNICVLKDAEEEGGDEE